MSTTVIKYADIAIGAEESAVITPTGESSDSVPARLPAGIDPVSVPSLELNSWALNGTRKTADDYRPAFWSRDISSLTGAFSNCPTIEISFDAQYSATGITIDFDLSTGDFCSEIAIQWYHGRRLLADETFFPDAPQYFCQKTVELFDRIVISVNRTRNPYRRAKISRIVFGRLRTFDMSEIRSPSITNEMDLLTMELPISTLRWSLQSVDDVEYMFQRKQPMEIWNGDRFICEYYIENSYRIAEGLYEISCQNAWGVLDEIPFPGGVYENKSANELMQEIIGGDFDLTFEVDDTILTGAILPGSKRSAAHQVLFAWGVCASTDGQREIRIFRPGAIPAEIGTDRTFLGAEVRTDSPVTQVIVAAHTFTPDANGSIEINGQTYTDTKTMYIVDNPNTTPSDKQRVKQVNDATLVSPSIGRQVAQRVYNYYARRNTHSAKIVWDGERLGDCVEMPNAWGGTNTGNIISMEIALSNTVVATCKAVGVM